MTTRRPSTNLFLIAFAAIVGMLSFADVAFACSTMPVSAPSACCANRSPSECVCCGGGEALPSASPGPRGDSIVSSPDRVPLQAPSATCECRASEPAAPSERPAQRTSTDRSEMQGGENLAAFAPTVRPSPAPGHLLLQNESPPKSPLYLRTSRLLI